MDYDLNKEQNLIKKTAREFLSKECDSLFVRDMEKDEKGFSPKIWNKLSELGWLGLIFPDEYGGLSGSYLDLVVLLMEMGYHCMPGPFFSTVVLGGITLMEAGSAEQKKDILTKISDGELFVTLAITEMSAGYTPDKINVKAEKNKDGFVINGTKLFVPDAHIADKIICVVRTTESDNKKDGITLFIVDQKSKGLEITPLDTFAGDKLSEINFNNVCVTEKDIIGEQDNGWAVVDKVIQLAAIGKCAEMVGGGERSMEIAIENSKGREQFGRKVGSFQAVQHHCANILTYLDTSRMMTYQAAWKISEGLPFDKNIAMTKAWVGDSCRQLVALSHQVMGGLGFMEEYDLQLFFRKTKAAGVYYGNADFYRDVLAEKLGM